MLHSSSCSFLFFNLMLLWVLSCLYENKNNLSASAGAQPLPKALPAPGGSAHPTFCPPKCNDPEPLPVPRGWGFLTLQPSQTGICAYRGLLGWSSHQLMAPSYPCPMSCCAAPGLPSASLPPSPILVPPVLCPWAPNKPQREGSPLCPSPAQPWQQDVPRPTRNSRCPGQCGQDPGCLPVPTCGQEGPEPG